METLYNNFDMINRGDKRTAQLKNMIQLHLGPLTFILTTFLNVSDF